MASRGTILVVDDDHDVRDSVIDLLGQHGYQAVGAGDGTEALDILRASASPPDAILLDLMMPVMDGVRFRDEQLADPSLAGIPVIVMSAFTRTDQPPFAAAGFLHKPFATRTLLDLLRTVSPA
jgi:CheY-like chemotaxis protein